MNLRKLFWFSTKIYAATLVLLALLPAAGTWASAATAPAAPAPTISPAPGPILPGEVLTYMISWSKVFSAGTAVMEVRREEQDGREIYRLLSTARSVGMVDSVYPVRDTVQSVFDPRTGLSSSYLLDQSHGKRKKKRELVFDRQALKVAYKYDGVQEVCDIPPHAQDALSSLYVLRSHSELQPGKTIVIDVHDSGKNWSVEVQVLAKERISTPLGEFDTIKVRTYPKYEGVFMHKGEITIWMTDDSRRVPVLMKSTITIGSIVATLTDMKPGRASK